MTTLLIVDQQKDFGPGGNLYVPDGVADAACIAAFVRKNAASIDRIVMTQDSRHRLHISNRLFWTDAAGEEHPEPFTTISVEDIQTGRWVPRKDLKLPPGTVDKAILAQEGAVPEKLFTPSGDLALDQYCVWYIQRLEARGRPYGLGIYPEHTLMGTEGHAFVDNIMQAVLEWSDATGGSVEWVMKGQNLLTESYSALQAEVPINKATAFNQEVFESLRNGTEQLVIVGGGTSHCVGCTARDIAAHWPKDEVGKVALLENCMSAVPGFEAQGEAFLDDMKKAGVNVQTTSTFKFEGAANAMVVEESGTKVVHFADPLGSAALSQ